MKLTKVTIIRQFSHTMLYEFVHSTSVRLGDRILRKEVFAEG